MTTDQEQRLTEALHAAPPHPALGVDLSAVMTQGRRARRRRRQGEAAVATLGIAAVATAGVWAGETLFSSTPEPSATAISVSAAQETYGVEQDTDQRVGAADLAIQRAGQAAQGRQYDCVESHGVPVERFADGSAQIGPVDGDPAGGSDQTHRLMRLCGAQAGFPETAPLSAAQLSELYALNLDAVNCLQEHGFTPAPTRSEEEFITAYEGSMSDPDIVRWTPYQGIDDPAAVEACPAPLLHG